MKFVARVIAADGAPLAAGTAELVTPGGTVARGKIAGGALSLSAEPGPVWGVTIDGKPVIAVPVSADAERVDLGEIVLIPGGIPAAAFHAENGRLFGAPRSVLVPAAPTAPPAAAAPPPPAAAAPPPAAGPVPDALADLRARITVLEADLARRTAAAGAAPLPAPAPLVTTAAALPQPMTFGAILGSTAQQLTSAAVAKTGLSLAGASLSVKGIPASTADAIGIVFPTPEVAATGAGLTELSFNLKAAPSAATAAVRPKGTGVPDFTSYTRELASRKLAALGLFGEFASEAVGDPSRVGRVVRQLPKPGSEATPGSIIRLFIGT